MFRSTAGGTVAASAPARAHPMKEVNGVRTEAA